MADQMLVPQPSLNDLKAQFHEVWSVTQSLARRSVEGAHKAGSLLTEIKAKLKHGEWLPWLDAEGVSHRQASKLMKLATLEIGTLCQFDNVEAAIEFERKMRLKADRAERDAKNLAAAEEREGRDRGTMLDIRHCECAGLMLELEPESVDAIITDPPYEQAAIPAFRDLRDLASKVLKPGGHLVVMTGSMFLPQWFAQLEGDPEIVYRYAMSVRLLGATTQNRPRKMVDGCKPVLLYNKAGDHKDGWRQIFNAFDSEAKKEQEADHHVWQQSLDVFQHLLGKFASPGDVVCDPFLGGGTTAVAAVERGCNFIGADADEGVVAIAKQRLGID